MHVLYYIIIMRTKSQLGWLHLPHLTNTTATSNYQVDIFIMFFT